MKQFALILFSVVYSYLLPAQTALSIGTPRVYFVADAGQNQNQTIQVTNPSKDYALELGVSVSDWNYAINGDNNIGPAGSLPTTCASWLSFSDPFFVLNPGETKQISLSMQVPQELQYNDSVPVHTAMLFITQLNPKLGQDKDGANIRIALRSGIKIYHRFSQKNRPDIEITDLRYIKQESKENFVEVSLTATGNIWMEGETILELINQENGSKIKLDKLSFFCLPNDKRIQYIKLPSDLPPAEYIASVIVNYGVTDQIKIGELEFTHATD